MGRGTVLLHACLWLALFYSYSSGTSHLTVTKKGIVAYVRDSPFAITAPYDLMQFLNQETIRSKMATFREQLVEKMRVINERCISDDPTIESKIMECEPDRDVIALFARIPGTFPTSLVNLREMGFRQKDIDGMLEIAYQGIRRPPRCDRYLELPVSVAAMDHIESIRNPSLLHHIPETAIPEMTFSEWMTTADYGASIANNLKRSPRSWLLYTLASYYWRALGNSTEAIQCLRRAVYLVPRQFLVIPMLSLLNVLGNGNRMGDAAKVADIALAFNDTLAPLAITSSLVYASTSQHRKALLVLEKILAVLPPTEALRGFAETYVRAIRCHEMLEAVLEEQHVNLKSLMEEIESYKAILEQGRMLLNNFGVVADVDSCTESQTLYNYFKYGHSVPGLECSIQSDSLAKPRLRCQIVSQAYHAFLKKMKKSRSRCDAQDDQSLFVDIEDEEDMDQDVQPADDDQLSFESSAGERSDVVASPYAEWMQAVQDAQPQAKRTICLAVPDAPPQVFVSPVNKGVRIRSYWKIYAKLKTDSLAHFVNAQPVCSPLPNEGGDSQLSGKQASCDGMISELLLSMDAEKRIPRETELWQVLWQLFGPGTQSDFIHFLNSMITYRIGPRWLMYNLATLYWRLLGQPAQALQCLCSALDDADGSIYRDMALAQASVLAYNVGRPDLAVDLARRALEVDDSEAETHLLLGYYNAKADDYSSALYHLNLSLELGPQNRAQAALLFKAVKLLDSGVMNLPCFGRLPEEHCRSRRSGETVPGDDECSGVEGFNGYVQLFSDAEGEDEYQPALRLSDGSYVSTMSDEVQLASGAAEQSSLQPIGADAGSQAVEPHQEPSEEAKEVPVRGPVVDTLMPKVVPENPLSKLSPGWNEESVDPLYSETQCKEWVKQVNLDVPVTVWLSTQAKGISVSEFIDFESPPPVHIREPFCPSDFAGNMWTMDHLAAYVHRREETELKPESGLSDVFIRLNPYTVETVPTIASRIAEAINVSKDKGRSIWVATLVASLYWRIVGNCSMAIDCLRHSVAYAPVDFKDIGLINLANTYERIGFHTSALIAASVSLRLSPNLVIVHFALANIYVALGDLERAVPFFYSTLLLQGSFEPALERVRVLQCMLLYNLS